MPTIEAIADPVAPGVETKDMEMMALVYGGPGQRAWEAKPKPLVRDPGDAVVRITTTTICGTDLHIMTAYDTFGNAAKERALKVILTNGKAGAP